MSESSVILKNTDLYGAGIGEGLVVLITNTSPSPNRFALSVAYKIIGRQLGKVIDAPDVLIFEGNNVIAGLVGFLDSKFRMKRDVNTSLRIGLATATGSILGAELVTRLNIEEKILL